MTGTKRTLPADPKFTFAVTPPMRDCYLHGSHAAWLQFRFGADDQKQPHYCMRCIRDFLNTSGIGQANE